MTFVDGYFYMMSDDGDVLVQKLDDGGTAFSYPLSTLLTDTVTSLEHDGINFWSMHDIIDGVSIERWQIENNISELKDTFDFTPNFDSDAFTVEHYHTTLASGVTTSGTVLYLDNYTNLVNGGVVLTLGPNSYDQYEEVNISTVSGSSITLVSGTQNSYGAGDGVNFYNNLWIFNNYSVGTLHKINAYTGSAVTTYSGAEYDSITACTFTRVRVTSDVDTLVYVKSTNLKFLNTNDMNLYGVMTIDNLNANQVTEIIVYDLAVSSDNIYRLQNEATYYETDYSWGALYNYVLSTSRRFVDTVSISAYPTILPANSVNVTEVTMLVDDQYGDGVYNKPVFFVDDDAAGFMTISPAYTDYFFGTGEAISYYKAGITPRTVNIEGTSTQFN